MRFIFIVLFLVSFGSVSMGDVYYCDERIHINIEDHKIRNYSPNKFKFKWANNKIVFGSEDNYFSGYSGPFEKQDPTSETFKIQSNIGSIKFNDGHFYFSSVQESLAEKRPHNRKLRITIITAICSKF
jgi:hypothetical protein